jgi:sugar transferase (PEP-CTERM/EpsH1 system associated)
VSGTESGEQHVPEGIDRLPKPMRPGPAPRPLSILFLYSRLPLPMTRGDELTVAHLLEFLHARGHAVDFVTLAPGGRQPKPVHRAWLESRTRELHILPHPHGRAVLRAALGWLRGLPAQIGLLSSPAQDALAERLARGRRYDLAYAYYIRSTEALTRVKDLVPATFLALQLSQTLNTERLARTAASLPERLFYRFEHRRIAAYEARIWQRFSRTVLIGEKDRQAILEACRRYGEPPIDNVVFGPHGVDTERFAPRDPALVEPELVVMTGVMRYAPNVEAALWFAREVWPRIRAARPQARFALVGRDPVPALLALDGRDGIRVTGTVPDTGDWIARAAVCVAPIRAAAGLQNKLLEAMAMARPVVATPEANEGIGAAAGRDLLLAREPDAFAGAVLRLLADRERAETLGRAARAFVEAHWTWEGPFLALEREFYRALGEAEADAPVSAAS